MATRVRECFKIDDAIFLFGDTSAYELDVKVLNQATAMITGAKYLILERIHLTHSTTSRLFELLKCCSSKWKGVFISDCFGPHLHLAIKTMAYEYSEDVFVLSNSDSQRMPEYTYLHNPYSIVFGHFGSKLCFTLRQTSTMPRTELLMWGIDNAKNDQRIQEITFCFLTFSRQACDLFCELLSSRPCWKRVRFSFNWSEPQSSKLFKLAFERCDEVAFESLTEESLDRIRDLDDCPSLPNLEFQRCALAISTQQHFQTLQLALCKIRNMERLTLVACKLTDEQLANLVATLPTTATLKKIELGGNYCGAKTPIALAKLLRSSSCQLELLDLSQVIAGEEPCDFPSILTAWAEEQPLQKGASYSQPILPSVRTFRFGQRRDTSHVPNEIAADRLLSFATAFTPACRIEEIDAGEWVFPVSVKDDEGGANEQQGLSSTQAVDQLDRILLSFLLSLKGGNSWLTRIFGNVPREIRRIVDGGETKSRQILKEIWTYLALNKIGLRKSLMYRQDDKHFTIPMSLCWPFLLKRVMNVGAHMMNDKEGLTQSLTPNLPVTLLFETLRGNSSSWHNRRIAIVQKEAESIRMT